MQEPDDKAPGQASKAWKAGADPRLARPGWRLGSLLQEAEAATKHYRNAPKASKPS